MKMMSLFSQHTLITLFTLFISLFFTSTNSGASFFEPTSWSASPGSNPEPSIAWRPDGNYLAVGEDTGWVYIYSFNGTSLSLVTSKQFTTDPNRNLAVTWSPDGTYLAVGSTYIYIYSFNGSTLTSIPGAIYNNLGDFTYSMAWSPDGKYLAATTDYIGLQIFSFNGTTLALITIDLGSYGYSLSWGPDGTYIALLSYGSILRIFTFNNPTLTQITTYPASGETSVAWSPNEKNLAIGGNGVQILNFNGTEITETTAYPSGSSKTVAWNTDGTCVSIGRYNPGDSKEIQTLSFNGKTLSLLSEFNGGAISSMAITWSPNGNYLATISLNGSTMLLQVYKRYGVKNGLTSTVSLQNQVLFSNGGAATGNVSFKNGFTLGASEILDLNIFPPINGPINLGASSIVNLNGDIYLGSQASLNSSNSFIRGNNHTIYLGNNLTTIDNTVLHISSDTAIDGQGHTLTLANESQFFVDWGVTLTLKNLTLKNTNNNTNTPPIRLNGKASKLALDNVELALSSDFSFTYGQLFIHNDVIVTGTSQFNYLSSRQSYIDDKSTLYFDTGTTFSFAPYFSPTMPILVNGSNSKDLLNMKNASSILYLNGATLAVTHTGLRLTKGQLFLKDNVTFTSQYYEGSHKQALTNSIVLGNAALGPNYNLGINLLKNAKVTVNGLVLPNNA